MGKDCHDEKRFAGYFLPAPVSGVRPDPAAGAGRNGVRRLPEPGQAKAGACPLLPEMRETAGGFSAGILSGLP